MAYNPKKINDTTQYPESITFVAAPIGTPKGKLIEVTAAAAGTLDLGYETIVFITGAASTATLGPGTNGQELTMVMHTDGGDMVVTCAVLVGGNTITFDNNDSITLIFDGTEGEWLPVGTPTAAITTV